MSFPGFSRPDVSQKGICCYINSVLEIIGKKLVASEYYGILTFSQKYSIYYVTFFILTLFTIAVAIRFEDKICIYLICVVKHMSTVAVIGCTGQVGSHLLSTLLGLDTIKAVHTISRRSPRVSAPKLSAHVESDTARWISTLAAITPPPDVVFSALGTTREQAGGAANQWKIDHDCEIAPSPYCAIHYHRYSP